MPCELGGGVEKIATSLDGNEAGSTSNGLCRKQRSSEGTDMSVDIVGITRNPLQTLAPFLHSNEEMT